MARLEPVAAVSVLRAESLTGRDGELARLEQEFAQASQARAFRVVFVRGPAGVGRSALLDAFARRLSARDVPVVAARARRPHTATYGLVQPLLTAVLERLRPVASAPVVRALEERLAPVFGRDAADGAAPIDLGAALADAVLRAAHDQSIALLLDDVDAADPASLALVSYLLAALTQPGATRAPDEPVAGGLVALSLRDDAMPKLLADLVARTAALSLPLGALDLDGVRAYLARTGAAERLLEATGGVPARLEELLAPAGAIDLAARRLERLPAADREVLQALALVGVAADAELVARISGRKDAAARLTRLAQAGLVAASPGSGRTLFTLVREGDRRALQDELGAKERGSLLRAAGDALSDRGEDEAAFHLFLQAGLSDLAAETGLRAASRLVAQLAFDAAEAILAPLSQLPFSPARKADVLLALAQVLERKSDARGALAALGRARACLPVVRRPALRARAARLCLQLGAAKPAERLARAVLAAKGIDPDAVHDARVALAEARFLRGAYEEAIAASQPADATPAVHRLLLTNVRGKALLTLGRFPEAKESFQHNAEAAEACGEVAERARALLNVGVVAHRQGNRDEARAAYRDALARGDSPLSAFVHANLSSLLREEGDIEQALSHAHRALAAFARLGRQKEQAHAASNLAGIYLFVGDLDRADELAAHAGQLASRVGDPYVAAGARLVAANVLVARGNARAVQVLGDVALDFERLRNPRYLCESLLFLAEAQLVAGDWAAAVSSLERARAAGALDSPALAAELHLLEAEAALAAGNETLAASALAGARQALLAAPQLELPCQLYFLLGALAERRHDTALAQAERLKAARILDEIAQRVPPDRRALFFARRRRRAILDAAGRAVLDVGRLPALPSLALAPSGDQPSRPIVGRSAAIQRINALIERIGPSQATVLVRGESGTGKELVAHALHERSPRRALPLVAINCGALSEELLLSELFGHEKGAFTGALRERKGRFEQADGGTIFLDEIGDISPRAQVALLRVLQERTFERVGGNKTIKVDVRVVCATNRNLEELMARGEFREDLYYRLRGASLTLPPLRERPEDLPELCEHILRRQARERGDAPRTLSGEALRLLARYRWPGNVRELTNVLESAALMAGGSTLGPEAFELFPELFEPASDLVRPPAPGPVPAPQAAPAAVAPLAAAAPPAATPVAEGAADAGGVDFYTVLKSRGLSLKDLRHELDLACIASALAEGSGNISEAARLLKMKRSRLSQIVNAEASLRALCRPQADGGLDDELDDEGGT